VLTLAQEARASGRETLEAFVAGYEVGTRIGIGLTGDKYFYEMGFHPVGTWPTLGISVACSKLMGNTLDQTRMAMALAASGCCGIRRAFGWHVKPFHSAYAGRNGMVAAQLAKKDFLGHMDILDDDPNVPVGSSWSFSFPRVFGGAGNYNLAAMVEGLGVPLKKIAGLNGTKFRPGVWASAVLVDMMLELMQKHGFTAKDVESVDCSAPKAIVNVAIFRDPQTSDQAKYSAVYHVAAALLDGEVGLDQFTEKRVHKSDIRDMMKRISWHERTDITSVNYESDYNQSKMVVKLKDGQEFTAFGKSPRGAPDRPATEQDLIDKYIDCAKRGLGDAEVKKSLELLKGFEKMKDVGELMNTLAGKA
jgi:2-methylcitrate dehydratase PrpD